MPDTINHSYTDTDTGNDVTHCVGHTYITYVAHTIRMFQNITLLCFETYIQYAIRSELLVTLSKEKLINSQLHALFFWYGIGVHATVLTF